MTQPWGAGMGPIFWYERGMSKTDDEAWEKHLRQEDPDDV